MIKKIYILFFVLFISGKILSQGGKWTWMNGSNISNQPAVFGTMGVPAAANTPGASYEAVSWQDKKGYLWMYGGNGSFSNLWRFDPYTDQWTWINGPGSLTGQSANYGTQGVASASNHPGIRGNGVASWIDVNDNLWLFGGLQGGMCNDLWKFDIITNLWTWMSGAPFANQTGVYGTQGVPSASNVPGARYEVICSWTNNGADLWLYGGYNGSFMNDLWKYSITSGQWTWMKGSSSPGQPSVYGTFGIANNANHPGARCAVGHWVDALGNFWLIGGNGPDLNGVQHCFNDMWKYDPSTNLWTWMQGSQSGFDPGWYKSYCTPTPLSNPAPRYEHYSCAANRCGDLWVFGGGTFTSLNNLNDKNDLWRYDINANLWIWLSGDSVINALGSYGTKFVPSITNVPGSRNGAIAFFDTLNNFWLFGGKHMQNSNLYNDTWKFTVDTSCSAMCNTLSGPPNAGFSSVQTAYCGNVCFSYSDTSSNFPYSWQWSFPGAQTTSSSVKNPANICYSQSGTYTVSLIVCNTMGCDTIVQQVQVAVPATPTVSLGNDTTICTGDSTLLTATPGYATYQWYLNSSLLPVNSNSLMVSQGGQYAVVVTNSATCSASDTLLLTLSSVNLNLGNDTALCSNQPLIVLNAGNNGSTYQWFNNGSPLAVTSQTLAVNQTGNYSAQVTNAYGCKVTDSIYINFHPLPYVNTIKDTAFCLLNSVMLNTTGAVTYSWSPSIYLNNPSISSPVSTPTASVTYIVFGTDSNGCSDSDTVNITILSLPIVDLGGDTSVCANQPVVLSVAGGYASYQWFSNGTFVSSGTSTLTVTQSGSYYVVVTDQSGCSASDSANVFYFQIPIVTTIPDTQFCGSASLVLTTTGALTYTWTPPLFLSNSTTSSPLASPTTSITYYVSGTDTNGCNSTDSVTISILPLPSVTLGNDTSVCAGQSVLLNAGSAANYQWYNNGNPLSVTTQTLLITQSGNYVALISNSQGCKAMDSVSVNIVAPPAVNTIQDTSLCGSASVTLNTTGASSYTWSPGTYLNSTTISAPVSSPLSSITYTVTGTDNQGCTNTDEVTLTVLVEPVANFSVNILYGCDGIEAHFTNTSSGAGTYSWNFGDGGYSSEMSPVHFYTSVINTSVYLAVNNGPCKDTMSIYGLSFQPPDLSTTPNIFTPNDDGINDCFYITSSPGLKNCFFMVIFNRWGTKVFETTSDGSCWNGELFNNGEKMPDGVYFFIAEVGQVKIKGHIQLIR